MSDHGLSTTVNGSVTDVFAHRFVVQGGKGRVLADLGKHNGKITLSIGDKVEITGEQKPSELKVHKMLLNGRLVAIEPKKKDHHGKHNDHDERRDHNGNGPADPAIALRVADCENIVVLGEPRRKPQHFELVGTTEQGQLVELHIGLDGKLQKTKPIDADDNKWAGEIGAA